MRPPRNGAGDGDGVDVCDGVGFDVDIVVGVGGTDFSFLAWRTCFLIMNTRARLFLQFELI